MNAGLEGTNEPNAQSHLHSARLPGVSDVCSLGHLSTSSDETANYLPLLK